jgi:hypothetical protein
MTTAAAPELASVIGDRSGAALTRFLASPAARPQLNAFYPLGLLGDDAVLKDWLKKRAGVVGASSSSR